MSPPDSCDSISSLLESLNGLMTLHHELTQVVHEKVRRMRRADVDALRQSAAEEQTLVARIAEAEGVRRQLMEKAGRSLGMSAARARAMTVRQLAERLPEPIRGKLFAMAQSLQRTMSELTRANRIAGMASGRVLQHLGNVLTAPEGNARGETYASENSGSACEKRRLFEAVG